MAWDFEVIGWEDYDQNPDPDGTWYHKDEPEEDRLDEVYGMYVHCHNDETGEDRYFWAYADAEEFESWEEWMDYIGILMESNYGLELA